MQYVTDMTSNQPEATMTYDNDMELVTRTLQGDAIAFGTLVERYQQAVHPVCVSILYDFDLAQDLTQETFLKALQHLHRLAAPARFGNWLRIIAVNECRLYIRRKHLTVRPERPFYEQAPWDQAHHMSVEQQQEMHQQQDEHDRLDLAALDAKHHQPGKPHLQVKCGLQIGKLFVGELSPRRPPTYTFLGMAAGIASTLKSANHRFRTAILAGRETYERAQETIEVRPVGHLKARFQNEPIMAYEVLARKGALACTKMQASARYLEGLAHYQARQWERALPAFTEVLRLDPSEGPSRFYQERCEALLAAPPEVIVL